MGFSSGEADLPGGQGLGRREKEKFTEKKVERE